MAKPKYKFRSLASYRASAKKAWSTKRRNAKKQK